MKKIKATKPIKLPQEVIDRAMSDFECWTIQCHVVECDKCQTILKKLMKWKEVK